MTNRFLIDYDNPDAGIGHSLGILNRCIKIARRNNLQFAYSEKQLLKSHKKSFRWSAKQYLRKLRGRPANETHNIGNDLNKILHPTDILVSREIIEQRIKCGEIKLIELPEFEIHIPSNNQNDDEVYGAVDQFIKNNPEKNIAFKINNNRFGDYEYQSSRDWFINAYIHARHIYPITLSFNPQKLNVAVHIRRGDLLPGRQFSDLSSRMLPDAWYLKILDSLKLLSKQEIAIHIFSEGRSGCYHSEIGEPFSWKKHFQNTPFEVHEHIDSDFMSTFHHLLNANILIGSKSGMSHLAATLGRQTKLMPHMWHSYRGVEKLLELPDSKDELNTKIISDYLKKNI
jgi:hypothetical protein